MKFKASNGKTYTLLDTEIKAYMGKYGLSKTEAATLILEDREILQNEIVNQLTEKADGLAPRREITTPYKKKIIPEKEALLEALGKFLGEYLQIEEIERPSATKFKFEMKGNTYELTLSKKRG